MFKFLRKRPPQASPTLLRDAAVKQTVAEVFDPTTTEVHGTPLSEVAADPTPVPVSAPVIEAPVLDPRIDSTTKVVITLVNQLGRKGISAAINRAFGRSGLLSWDRHNHTLLDELHRAILLDLTDPNYVSLYVRYYGIDRILHNTDILLKLLLVHSVVENTGALIRGGKY